MGDVEGRFNTLFSRVDTINKKSGPFDMLLCVGNFFGVNNMEFDAYKRCLKQGTYTIFYVYIINIFFLVCIPTYILGPNKDEHIEMYPDDVTEFCPNVNYLGEYKLFIFSAKNLIIIYYS